MTEIKKQYDILALQKMELSMIYVIATDYGVEWNCKNKQTIMREILDAQAERRAGCRDAMHCVSTVSTGDEVSAHSEEGWMMTYTGKKFDLINPLPAMVDIRDIAQGLAYNSHFAGQMEHYFSIAQHCLLVCDLMPEEMQKDSRLMMLALLHDASEAYIGDMIKPLKVHLPAYVLVEDKIMKAVALKFKLDLHRMKEIKPYDIQAQQIEYDNFYKGAKTISYLSPTEAVKLFKLRYIRYYYD